MSSIAAALIVFACVFGGALIGMAVQPALPKHHLSEDTKDVMKMAIALLATLGALVLGLLISSAKTAHDTRRSELVELSANIALLDRVLAHYGPETGAARAELRSFVAAALDRIGRNGDPQLIAIDAGKKSPFEEIYDKVEALTPATDAQRALFARATDMIMSLGHSRVLLSADTKASIPLPFLIVLVFWFTVIFCSIGIFAPRNATVAAVLLVSAVSVAGAIFLILELDRSFEGIIQISSAPLRDAFVRLGQ